MRTAHISGLSIRSAELRDVEPASQCWAASFAEDPLMYRFFRDHPWGQTAVTQKFFAVLMRARLTMSMPVIVLSDGEKLCGAIMGNKVEAPEWPDANQKEWAEFEASGANFAPRLQAYEKMSKSFDPSAPHYYLGTIGINPSFQGKGAGKILLEQFCHLSAQDPRSTGVYLETASEKSLAFYLRNGFVLRGKGLLEDAPIWCVSRSD